MAHQQIRVPQSVLRGVASATTAATIVIAGGTATAFAQPRDPMPPVTHPWGYSFGARQPGDASAHRAGGVHAKPSPRSGEHKGSEPDPTCGLWRAGIQGCTPIPLPKVSKPSVTPDQLAAEAWQQLRLPVPHVRTAPPRGSNGLVGLAEWFWVTNWSSHSSHVQAGGVWATVTARPNGLNVDPGFGPPIACAGPGTAFDHTRPADVQRSDCSFTYERSSAGLAGSAYQVTVTVTWGGTWIGSGATGGSLPALARSTTFPLRVAEGQAVAGG